MPFACDTRGITGVTECVGKGSFAEVQSKLPNRRHAVGTSVSSRQARSATGRADCQGDESVFKPYTAIGDSI
jgi:hypothetical protein